MDSLHALSNFGVRFIICDIGLMVVFRKDNMAERRFYVQSGVNISHTTKRLLAKRYNLIHCDIKAEIDHLSALLTANGVDRIPLFIYKEYIPNIEPGREVTITFKMPENAVIRDSVPPNKNAVFGAMEQMPIFPGGEAKLMEWVKSHMQYPALCFFLFRSRLECRLRIGYGLL